MTDKQHVYYLPGEVAMTISTGRHEMMAILINKVKGGHIIEPDMVVGVLEAFRDLIKMRYYDGQRVMAVERVVIELGGASVKDVTKITKRLRGLVSKIGSSEPLDPKELE